MLIWACYLSTVLGIQCINTSERRSRSTNFGGVCPLFPLTMSSTQEYKEARVQYWEEMLGFEYSTNSTKFRAFTACKALCNHVDAVKASAAYYTTDYQTPNSKALQNFTNNFFDDWASQLWPNHNKRPKWLRNDDANRLRVPRDSEM